MKPDLDVIRIQDTEMTGADDPSLLEWVATEARILLTHDAETMIGFAYERVANGLPMSGIFEIRDSVPIQTALQELVLIIDASDMDEWKDRVTYIPLR